MEDAIEICTSVFLELKGVQNLLDLENPDNEPVIFLYISIIVEGKIRMLDIN